MLLLLLPCLLGLVDEFHVFYHYSVISVLLHVRFGISSVFSVRDSIILSSVGTSVSFRSCGFSMLILLV